MRTQGDGRRPEWSIRRFTYGLDGGGAGRAQALKRMTEVRTHGGIYIYTFFYIPCSTLLPTSHARAKSVHVKGILKKNVLRAEAREGTVLRRETIQIHCFALGES